MAIKSISSAKKLSYNQAHELVNFELEQIGRGNLISFCKEHKINYNSLRNFRSDTNNEYPKLILTLLNIFHPNYILQTEYSYIKETPLKTHSNENPRPVKSRNRSYKKRS
jgi:hypothetical protein